MNTMRIKDKTRERPQQMVENSEGQVYGKAVKLTGLKKH
jgi:hypothetical protein